MKILFLTSRVPYPPHRGDKLRTYNFLRSLGCEHDIALLSFAESASQAREARAELRRFCASMTFVPLQKWRSWAQAAILYPLPLPSQTMFYLSLRMARVVRSVSATFRPDAVYIHLFRMMAYRRFLHPDVYTILDLTDVISKELFRSVPYRLLIETPLILHEARAIRRYERRATTLADETWVISREDQEDLLAAGGGEKIHVVPNGLPETPHIARRPDPTLLLFYGYASAYHNRDALRLLSKHILPTIHRELPAIRLAVVGAGKRDTAFAGRQKKRFPIDDLGFLDNPAEIFSRAALLVAPVRFSAGVQNKILEAMAAGVPVATSPFGNEGIGGIDGEHVAVCESPGAFATRITELLQHPNEREAMGKRGQAYVREHFSWNLVRQRVRAVEENIRAKHLWRP